MSYIGDIRLGDTFDIKFCTTAASTGAPTTLSGSPVISAYPGNSTTQLTAGITLSVDFDTVTGLNNCRVVATSGNGYATATNYQLVITTGTVGGTSAVGYVVGEFSIEARSAVMPTVAARTLDVAATGEAGLDYDNILLTNGQPKAGITASGTLSGTHSTTTADLGTNAPGANQIVVGQTVFFPAWTLSVIVTAYNTGTGVITFDTITPTLVDGNVWIMYPTAIGSAATIAAAVWDLDATAHQTQGTFGQVLGDSTSTASSIWTKTNFLPSVTAGAAGGVFIAGTNAATTVTTSFTTTFTGNLTGSVASVTGAVGSVTGLTASDVNAIKVQTDKLTFTVANVLDVNALRINGTAVLGNGSSGNLWRG